MDPMPDSLISPQTTQPAKVQPKIIWVITGIIVLLLVTIGGAWLWVSNSQKQFDQNSAILEQDIKKAHKDLEAKPKDTQEYIVYLEKNSSSFSKIINNSPKTPQLLWIKFPVESQKRVDDLINASKNLKSGLDGYRAFLVYRDSMLEIIKNSGGRLLTIDDLRTSKTDFEKTISDLEALSPPKERVEFHKQKIEPYKTVLSEINSSIAAYDKKDTIEFYKQVNKLAQDAKLIGLNKVVNDFLNDHYFYDQLTKAYDKLTELIE